VLIWLHCYWGDGAWTRGNLQVYMEPMELAAMKAGFLLVHPFGRGSQGYRFDGETDWRDVWKAVNDRWRIDPERVYLAGFSMGGSGTGNFCAFWPEMFAAGACYSGGMPAALAENVRHIPLRLELGGQESGASRVAKLADTIRTVEGRTAETIFAAHPSEGHTQDYIDFDALLDWFGRYRRVVDPTIVTFTTGDLKHASSYWVAIDRFEEYGKNARVDARLDGATITLKTTNVAALTVRPPPRRLEPGKPLRVVLNGRTVRAVSPDQTGAIQLACATQPATAPAGIAKTRTLCGPIQDAFSGPLMLVVADSSPALAKGAKVISDRWANWHHGQLLAIAEAEVDEAVLADSNVIVVGRWTPGGLVGKVSRSAPVTIDDKAITVSGKTGKGSDLGIIFVQPSPLNPQRYVVVITGQSDAGVLAACRMFEQDKYSGDYTVTGDGPRGTFDSYWR
jgi:pimeloyl-ACP methyl ester carboxylesterase